MPLNDGVEAEFTLHLLGGVRLEGPAGRLTGEPVQRHRLALLALLALARDGRLPRERLTSLLWPEHGTRQARDLLNSAVYVLRKALGKDVIRSEGDDLRLDLDLLRCDAVAFLEGLEAGDLHVAVDSYTGPLMDAFFLDAARDFEQWQDARRFELQAEYRRALGELATRAERADRLDEAEDWLRRLVRDRPADASATVRLMKLLSARGDRAGALQAAADHGAILEATYEAEPTLEVEALAREIREAPESTRVARSGRATLGDGSVGDGSVPASPRAQTGPGSAEARARSRSPLALLGVAGLATLIAAVLGTRLPLSAPSADPEAASVAVLPFVDLSPEGGFGYFGEGLTEELLNALARNPDLTVAARSSSFQFAGGAVDARDVGRSLEVASVVEGSVRIDGERLRVTAQLIDARTGYHLWSDQYDRRMDDVIAIQEEVAGAVAAALSEKFGVAFVDPRLSPSTTDPEAYRLYLLGRHEWRRRSEEGMLAALDAFQRATSLDPDFAAAHAGLADVWQLLPDYADVEASEGLARARTHALRAVALDSTLAEAQAALAALLADYDRDRAAAEATFRRAVELSPSYVTARHWLALYLADSGRHEEALEEIERARRLDPLSDIVNTAVGAVRYFGRDYDGAEAEYRAVLELQPDFALGWALLGRVQLVAGDAEGAVVSLERSVELSGHDPSYQAVYAAALAEVGREQEAREQADRILARHPDGYVPYCELASAYVRLGDLEQALALFEWALQEHDPALTHVDVEPLYDEIRDQPRFRAVVRAMGLDPDRSP